MAEATRQDAEIAWLRSLFLEALACCDLGEQAIAKYRKGMWSGGSHPEDEFAVKLDKIRAIVEATPVPDNARRL